MRTGWRSDGGDKKEDSQAGTPVENTSSEFNQLGIESSVSLASVQGVEHHHPTMRMPLVHGGRPRIIRKKKKPTTSYFIYNN